MMWSRMKFTMHSSIAAFAAAFTIAICASIASAEATALTCTFKAGVVKTFEKGAFKDEEVKELTFKIGDIDLVRQTAALETDQGRGDLKVVRAIGANHYLEVVTEGFLNMTTIYDAPKEGEPMPAVHSRHFGFFGAPFVSQYHGTCSAG